MTESDFEPFKLEIERLYIHDNKSLTSVMEYMTSKYSFAKSPGQYSRQLKKWGFVKGHIKADEWIWIGNKLNKRKLNDNKKSEFHIGGKEIHVPKLKKAKYRDAYVSSVARFTTAPSPKTPEGFFVYTPPSVGMDLTWNRSLPWLRFIKLVRPIENEEVLSPSSSLTVCSPRGADALSITVNHELMHRLSTIIPWNKLCHPPNIRSSSRTSAALSILMPEEFPGQHDDLSMNLSSSTNKGRDRMALELFLLSNNITSQDPGGRTASNIRSDDERVMRILSDYGWKNLEHIQILLSTREPTAEAIAEKIFASALRLHDVDAVKMMLEAHMNPNNPLIESISGDILTPLQFIAGSHHEHSEELVNLLISYGADVNHSCNENPPLFYAINEHDNRTICALMFHGAIVTPSCLCAATHLKDIGVFSDIADSCSDVNARTGWQDFGALAEAVKHGNVLMIEILLFKGANMNDLVTVDFEDDVATTTILGLGVRTQSIEVVRALLWDCYDLNPDFDGLPYISPVVLAVQIGSFQITQALLEAGVNINLADKQGKMTLLERATEQGFSTTLELWRVLIEYGAQVDRPASGQEFESSALLVAIQRNSSEVVELLINAGARLNDEYTKAPYTALGAAIEQGNQVLIDRLMAAGATLVGTKLATIGSLCTAMFLEQNGVLQGILRVSGPGILAAALSAKKANLVQYLLEHNADNGDRMENEVSTPSKQTPLEAAIRAQDFIFAENLLERGANVTDRVLADAIRTDPVYLEHLLARFCGSAPTAVGTAVSHGTTSLQLLQVLQGAGVDPTGVPQMFQNHWNLDDFQLPPPESVLEIAVVVASRKNLQFLLQWTSWSPRLIGRALTFAILLHLNELVEDILPFNPDLTQEITIQYFSGTNEFGPVRGEQETYRPLEAAVDRQMVPIARTLMGKIDVNYLGRGARRRTALQYAVERGNMELVNLLILEHGARIDSPPATDGGATALQIACLKGYIGITKRLLDLGADVNEAPAKYNGRTSLQGAAEHGRIDMLQILLDEGALIVGEGEPQYHKAVELAERNGHYAAARLLRSWRDSVYWSPSAVEE
ncbi:uncharacterized protein N7479_003604 [Penicillium vulpinum]|uniref:Clr5 domain-containing protein n=1 Tax=Penicillium vulpinum TaxID=29845 RepID=A0A1V6RW31_9EURO|nr:uncharacterized protein N7479_003604 [Penicillium vulpinum]KAJ5963728.1 hypothetical protein N7479_003604 [Penicillium vulpinum]OQE05962.1 hypothetical protein PENVUL_c020G01911 [Penicillium vulpinum]